MAKTRRSLFTHKCRCVDSYKLHGVIGSGVSAKVRRAHMSNSEDVAIKVIARNPGDLDALARAEKEVRLHMAVHNHPNIPTLYDFSFSDDKIFLVMERAPNGDLVQAMQDSVEGFSYELATTIFVQLVSAVSHMHAKNIAHRDIKPENVLLKGLVPMLCDFGSATEWTTGGPAQNEAVGTVRCLPPEMFMRRKNSGERQYNPQAVDVWGLGVVYFFLLTGTFPFDGDSDQEVMLAVAQHRFTNTLPDSVPQEAANLIHSMLKHDPHDRPTAHQLKRHPALTWCSGERAASV